MGQTLSRKDRILNGDKVAFPTKSEQILMKHVEGGGSGGGKSAYKVIGVHTPLHPINGGGTINYIQVGARDSNNRSLCLIQFFVMGNPADYTDKKHLFLTTMHFVMFLTITI